MRSTSARIVSQIEETDPVLMREAIDLQTRLMQTGTAMDRVNELRDPALFLDQGQVYLAYCGGGESGNGIARIDGL